MKKTLSILLISVLMIGILVGLTACGNSYEIETVSTSKIDMATDIIEEAKEELEVDSLDDLSECEENSSDELFNTYYFDQLYKGIRYYNHGILVYTDKDDENKGIMSSYEKMDNFDIEPKNSSEDLEKIVTEKFGEETQILSNELIIFDIDEENKTLAYLYRIKDDWGENEVIVSDSDEKILSYSGGFDTAISTEDFEKYELDDSIRNMLKSPKAIKSMILEPTLGSLDDEYLMMDKDRKIFVLDYSEDMNGDEVEKVNIGYYTWNDVEDLIDMNQVDKVLNQNGNKLNFTKDEYSAFGLKETTMKTVGEVYDYYKENFNYDSFDGKGCIIYTFTGVDHALNKQGQYVSFKDNAAYQRHNIAFGSLNYYNNDIEVVGHEFTHGIFRSKLGDSDTAQFKALNEAYADIMGMCIEAHKNNAKRIDGVLAPEHANRDITKTTVRFEQDNPHNFGLTEEHRDSKIISRAAYIMSEYMTLEEFETLWFESMNLLKGSHSFYHCEVAVLETAARLGFSKKQINHINDAFVEVGLYDINTDEFIENSKEHKTRITKSSKVDLPYIQDIGLEGNVIYKYEKDAKYLEDLEVIKKENSKGSSIDKIANMKEKVDYNGNPYKHGIEVLASHMSSASEEKAWVYSTYKLDRKYEKITGQCMLMNSSNTEDFDITIYIEADDKTIATYNLLPETIYPFEINLDVSGVDELKIRACDNKNTERRNCNWLDRNGFRF